jgi:hypothetical protein
MKLVDHFKDFLDEVVNLDDTRFGLLDESIDAIKRYIRGASWEPKIRQFTAQGSWAHKTIIRPIDGAPFDADLLVWVDHVDGWAASKYVDTLYAAFRESATYKEKVGRSSHCVTIEYAGERKIDVAPLVKDRGGLSRLEVCNRTADKFELSEPQKYTDWLIERNTWSGSNSFRKVTRLLKYLRDIKTTFTCASVLLTTLLGDRISAGDKDTDAFADVPSALKTVMGRLDDWLQVRPARPAVPNPFLSSERFGDLWSDDQYENFRDKIHQYREWIDDAFDETDRDESIRKWQRVFGGNFASGEASRKGQAVADVVLEKSSSSAQLVEAIRRGQRALLARIPLNLPYVQAPPWRLSGNAKISISAEAGAAREGALRGVISGDPIEKGNEIRFRAHVPSGLPLGVEVKWQVVNTGEEAALVKQLRGGFEASSNQYYRWETTAYTGVHWVRAYLVNTRTRVCLGKSDPYFVVVF